ncbi:MAG: ABC transporter permease [Acidobacteriota bacterium]
MNWRRYFHRSEADREQQAELESYLDIAVSEYVARGMTPQHAVEKARKRLGNPTRIREEIYHMNTIGFLDTLSRDVRYALRTFRTNPSFTAVAFLTLAIGIGANTAIFSVVNGVLIKPLPYPNSEALVGVWHSANFAGKPTTLDLSPSIYFTYQENNRAFEKFGVWTARQTSVTGMGDPEQVDALVVTQGVLPAIGVQPALGRWFSVEDDATGSPETVILTHGYWQRRWSGDRGVVGRTITVDARPHRIIGVMPQDFRFLTSRAQLILPQRFDRTKLPPSFGYLGVARLKPGVSLTQADADVGRMLPIVANGPGQSPRFWESIKFAPALRSLKQDVVGDVGQVLWILMGVIGIVLLIACANVANLLLVRAEGRQQELIIRAALGAGWRRIAWQLLIESMTLGVFGGALGLGFAYAGLRLLVAIGPANLPRLNEITIDPTVLLFTLGTAVLSGLLFGLIPVLKYTGRRVSTLRTDGRGLSQSRERHRSQNALVVMQVALALVLLVASGLMIRSFQAMRNVQPGFTQPERIQTVRISIPPAMVQGNEDAVRMQRDILEKLTAIPGVSSAAFASALPLENEPEFATSSPIGAAGKVAQGELPPIRRLKTVSPGSFKTVGTPLIAGRDFVWADADGSVKVTIVSEQLAKETWGTAAAALGQLIGGQEVVGVVGDVYDDGADRPAVPIVYWPARADARPAVRSFGFALRSSRAGTETFLNEIRQAVWSVNASLPLSRIQTLGELYTQTMARTSFTLVMFGIASSMALVLGIIGIYGVLSYAVSQRNREIGIRLALGAQPTELRSMFLRHGLVLAAIGVAIGLGAAAGLTRLMSSLLVGVSPLDPIAYGAAALVLALAAALASYIPARRVSAVDPMIALRAE